MEEDFTILLRVFEFIVKFNWLYFSCMFNREGRFDLGGSSHSSSQSLASLHDLDSALIPYEEEVRAESDSESHALSSPEDQSVRKIQFTQPPITFPFKWTSVLLSGRTLLLFA